MGTKINRLMTQFHGSGLLFSDWLKGEGYSEQLQKKYRDSGWLSSLSKGVMFKAGTRLSALPALASCNLQTGSTYRIAANSALEYCGFNHYVPMGKPVLTLALPKDGKRPAWMKDEMFDVTFRTFSTDTFKETDVIKQKTDSGILYVSSVELAFLECLLLAPKFYSYMDLFYIMEQLVTVRSEVVQRLLEATQNFRVKRMFLYMAKKAGHYWYDELDLKKIEIGSSKLQLVRNGVYIDKYRMTVPKDLNEYEG